MSVKEGKEYMDDAVRQFFEAGRSAKKMGVDGEQIVQMKPSLTTRSSKPSSQHPIRRVYKYKYLEIKQM